MKELLVAMLKRLEQGKAVVLTTVTGGSGSVPRGPGASLLTDENGYAAGTVGGGAVEGKALALAAAVLQKGGCRIEPFALHSRDAANLGMVCGGEMTLLFVRIDPADAALCKEALAQIAANQLGYFVIDTESGQIQLMQESPRLETLFALPLMAEGCAYVFGAGHVAQALVPVLAQAGFRVQVMDDRPEFANEERFPQADRVYIVDFLQLADLTVTRKDYVVIMTRGHEHDLAVLSQMLRTSACYIGMMGSKSKRAFVYGHLLEQGFLQADMERVHSPIGLPIGAETPWEIAVSIAAELIQVRAEGGRDAFRGEKA